MNNNVFKLGLPVSGDSFIGRHEIVSELEQKVFNNDESRCISVVGLPRIGKTSVAKEVFNTNNIKKWNYLLINVSCEVLPNDIFFWQTIVLEIKAELKRYNALKDGEFRSLINDFMTIESYDPRFVRKLNEIFDELKRNGKTILLVIDEFDRTRELFAEKTENFGLLRDICSQRGYLIKTVLISRRSIKSITSFVKVPFNSTLYGVFPDRIIVKSFNIDDMDEYYNIFKKNDIVLTNEQKKELCYCCGTHPYLLSFLGNEIISSENRIPIHNIHKMLFSVIKEYYDSVIESLKEDGTLQKLLECVIGPKLTVSKYDVDNLTAIGAVELRDGKYIAMTDCFADYAKTQKISLDKIWNLLEATQKKLQNIVKATHPDGYKDDSKEYSKMKKHTQQNKEIFGINTEISDVAPLRYTVSIILDKWELFKKYFNNENKEAWKEKLEFCADIRNPTAHMLSEFLTDEQKNSLVIYCEQIFAAIKKFENRNNAVAVPI